MIDRCRITPATYGNAIEEQRHAANIANSNNYFRRYGIRVPDVPDLVKVDAQQLIAPAIDYGQGGPRVEPENSGRIERWALGRNQKYFHAAPMPTPWCAVLIGQVNLSESNLK